MRSFHGTCTNRYSNPDGNAILEQDGVNFINIIYFILSRKKQDEKLWKKTLENVNIPVPEIVDSRGALLLPRQFASFII